MPNTEVKVFSVDDTWWETAREIRELPEQNPREDSDFGIFLHSSVGRANLRLYMGEKQLNNRELQ